MAVHNPYDDTELMADIAIIDALCDSILEDTVAIREVTDSEAILTEESDTITTDGTEQDLYINDAPAGVFRPICVKIDCTNHTIAETIVLRTYCRIVPAGNAILQDVSTYAGAIAPELINIDLEPNRYGMAVTIEKTAGTNREYDWEVFYEEAP